MTTGIILIFLSFYLLRFAVESTLALLNLGHVARRGNTVPGPLAGLVTPETARRSQAYTLAKGRFGLIQDAYGAVLTLGLLFSGVLPWLEGALGRWGLFGIHRFVVYLLVLWGFLSLAQLPFSVYLTFSIESRFGFNRLGWRLWVMDRLKGLVLAAGLGVPLLYVTYGFMVRTGAWWWVWLFAFLAAVQVMLLWLYPTLIAPLFNRFTPLPEGELKQRVEALARNAGFRMRGLYVVDASRRSGHANAYFAGSFRPRIVLFDTLVEKMSVEEALAVLAHEMGHYRRHHIQKRLVLGLAGLLLSLYVLSVLIAWPPLFQAFGFAAPSYSAALALLTLGSEAFTFFLKPVGAWLSRRKEYEADGYSVRLMGDPQALGSALIRLNDQNLSSPDPHPWYSRYHYTHPTLLERLKAIDAQTAHSGRAGQGHSMADAGGRAETGKEHSD